MIHARGPRLVWRGLFVVLLGYSLYAFFWPRPEVPAGLEIDDKLIHAGFFAALALTGLLGGIGWRAVVVGLLGYAVVSEVLQAVLPIGRDGDVLDAVADLVGVGAGGAVALVLLRVGRGSPASPARQPQRR